MPASSYIKRKIIFILLAGIFFWKLSAQNNPGGCFNCTSKKNPSAMNGNGSLGQNYTLSKCGLSYVQESVPLQRRNYQNIPSVVQPATVSISGIPSCGVIEKAFLYAGTSGDGISITATITNPNNVTANFPLTIIGSDISKCWDSFGYHQTFSYRADVTSCITGNGNYVFSNLPVAPPAPTDTNDVDGATLFIIYSNPNAQYEGRILIYDGAYVIGYFGTANVTMNGINACANSSFAKAFGIVADVQPQNGGVDAVVNGNPQQHINGQMWDFCQANTTVASGQMTSNFSVSTNGDCFNFEMAGLYYQTTSCNTCGSGQQLTANANPSSICAGNSVTLSASGGTNYSWSNSSTANSIVINPASTSSYTVSSVINGCTETVVLTVTVSPCSSSASCPAFINPDFEGQAPTISAAAPSWTICGSGTPDICPQALIGATLPASSGSTYQGGSNSTPEMWGQQLSSALVGGTQYSFTMDMYAVNYPPLITGNGQLEIWGGGTTSCAQTELLWTSPVIPSGGNWQNVSVSFTPAQNHTYILFKPITTTGLNYVCVDNIQCSAPSTPPSVTASGASACAGNCVTLTANASSGTPPYTYLWSGGLGTTSAVSACPSSTTVYTVTITDASGGTATATAAATINPNPTATISGSTTICSGSSATLTAGGGGNYSWNTNATTASINISPTTTTSYTVTVTNGNGCTSTATAIATVSPQINITTSSTNSSCGTNTGTATANASGGSGTFTYSWNTSPQQNSSTATGLSAGNYSVTVTDAVGCSSTQTVSVANSNGGTASLNSSQNVSCNGGNNGSATVSVSGGSSPFTYLWSNGQTTSAASNLSAGNYSVVVTDANGCSSSVTVTISQPAALSVTASSTANINCLSPNGSAIANPSGGTSPYIYVWSNGQTTQQLNNLQAGNYSVTITDANGCTTTSTISVAGPTLPTISISGNTTLCQGDQATLTASGGIVYSWSAGTTNNPITVSPSSTSTYTVVGADASGCTNTSVISVTVSPPPTANITGSDTICLGSSAVLTATGGGNYLWSTNETTFSITISSAGNYSVIVSIGTCTAAANFSVTTVQNPTANAGANVVINIGESTTLNASGGGMYSWSPSVGLNCTDCPNPVASPAATTNYCVYVANSNGCVDSACVTVIVEYNCTPIYVPNAFSPNGDNENDFFYIYGNCISEMKLIIYNRWGEKVFETTEQKNGWNGEFRGNMEDSAVFSYYFEYSLLNGERKNKKGNISLMR